MNKKIKLVDNRLKANCVIFSLFLIVAIVLAVITILYFEIAFLIITILLFLCVILSAYAVLRYCINWIVVNEKNITVKCCFGKIKTVKFDEIKNIYVCNFENTESIKAGRLNLGGVNINVPKTITSQWIFFDDGKSESGENIYEYFIPQNKHLPLRLKYKEQIIVAIKANYSKEIIEKTISL